MNLTVSFVLAALLTTAAAQGLGDLPNCSKECATGAIPENCGIDFKCICESKSFLADVACCVADKCSKADQDTTIKVAKSICARGGVTNLPSEVVCSSTSSKSSTSSTSTKTGAETGTEASVTVATKTDESSTVIGTHTSTTTTSNASSASASSSTAATSTAIAALAHKDSSLVAAAGAAAAFAILI